MPIILGIPFLAMGRTLVDIEIGDLKFRLNKEEVKFNIHRTMKHPTNIGMVLVINSLDGPEGQPYDYLDEV